MKNTIAMLVALIVALSMVSCYYPGLQCDTIERDVYVNGRYLYTEYDNYCY